MLLKKRNPGQKAAKKGGFGAKKAPPKTKGLPRRCPADYRPGKGKMAEDLIATTGIARHGASRLPSVDVDSFNIELKDDDGFLGDRASKGAFRKILDSLRKPLKKNGDDP